MRDEFLATEMESMAGWVEDCQHEISFDLDDDDLVFINTNKPNNMVQERIVDIICGGSASL